MSKKFEDLRFAVIDVEGNGQQPPEIIEIAIEPIEGLSLSREPQVWLVKPERPIAPIVTRKIHGIRNADVAEAPRWPDVAPDIAAALADRIPVAHNARVEYDVLRRHLPLWSPATVLDTLRLARAVWPGLGTYGLDPLLDHAGILLREESGRRHRAGALPIGIQMGSARVLRRFGEIRRELPPSKDVRAAKELDERLLARFFGAVRKN